MQNGARPTRLKHKDYDFLKSHKLGAIAPSFPQELLTDAGMWMPDQNIGGTFAPTNQPTIQVFPQPSGCTNFTQADLATDLTGQLHNPQELEAVTHANQNGGLDVRVSLDAARKLGWIKAYYNIRPSGLIDAFDAIRLATLSSLPEKRSVSWGTPWFPSWEAAAQKGISIMPMPTDDELRKYYSMPWHNSKDAVYKTINGVPYLKNKSWQGTNVGDNGWLYFPREVVNVVMGLKGTVAFTATNAEPGHVETVDMNIVQFIVSYIRNLFFGL